MDNNTAGCSVIGYVNSWDICYTEEDIEKYVHPARKTAIIELSDLNTIFDEAIKLKLINNTFREWFNEKIHKG